jgi:uncharacterized membrane protein YdjX (TVP38/TMEM64 family)
MDTNNKRKRLKGVIFLIIIVIFFGVIAVFVGKPIVTMASDPESFREWIDQFGVLSRVAFVGLVIIQNVIAVIPGEPLEICAGYAFGAVEGSLLCILGSVIGSIVVFCVVRKWGMKFVEIFFDRDKLENMRFFKNTRRLNLFAMIFMLIPGTPKDMLSYFVGLTKMKLSVWIFITAVGRLPSIVTSTIGGDGLGSQKYVTAAIVFGVTIVISLIGMLIYRRIFRSEDDEKNDKSQEKDDT